MEMPQSLRVVLLTFLVSGVLAPLTLWLPERWQGPWLLAGVAVVALVLVLAAGRWLAGRSSARQPR